MDEKERTSAFKQEISILEDENPPYLISREKWENQSPITEPSFMYVQGYTDATQQDALLQRLRQEAQNRGANALFVSLAKPKMKQPIVFCLLTPISQLPQKT